MKNLFSVLLLALLIMSCGDDDDKMENQEFKNGVFVLNQGAFGSGTGTLTFVENATDSVYQNVYTTQNEGAFLGNVAQSMIEHKGNKYISINNGGRIVVLEDESMTFVDTITGINQSRYFASDGDRLFVSAWGDGFNGGVYEINTTDFTSTPIIENIAAEGLLISNDKLYIASNGGFGAASNVIIVDLDNNEVSITLAVADKPELLIEGDNGEIFVICSGITDFYDAMNNTDGAIVKIVNDEVAQTVLDLTGINKFALDEDDNTAYFISAGEIVKYNLTNTERTILDIDVVFPFALTFDNDKDQLYIADAKDFNSQGELIVVDENGNLVKTYAAGIIPGFISVD